MIGNEFGGIDGKRGNGCLCGLFLGESVDGLVLWRMTLVWSEVWMAGALVSPDAPGGSWARGKQRGGELARWTGASSLWE
ncbi:hypothetical protein TIFTF001_044450 [Ficus carica]|uniref:Uncharacterized protein n=1 Tax=Ficus carica TaxID=3494 RepID=A0AA87ZWF7_FICCA|nr:hypothetical protein TIFTF001_044450 [Ficus carica]